MPLSKFLNIVNINSECIGFPEENTLAIIFPYTLDPFQKHAIKAIHNNENILLTCKTSAGKTTPAIYQIAQSLKKGKRVFYTTPIKSLSNQKFYDLKKLFPNNSVSLMTGDIKISPNADIVVMTTEILRNLLYKKDSTTENIGLTAELSIDNVDAVIFDEVHYINNKERGGVWEETLILLPKEINLVLLSATIDSADLFASWIGELKEKPIHLISTTYRIVPLEHYVMKNGSYETIMDSKDMFHVDAYNRWLSWKKDQEKNQKKQKDLVANRRLGGYEDNVVGKSDTGNSFIHQLNATIQHLYEKEMLPAIFFVFSRKNCEVYASKVSGSLIDPSDSAKVKHIIDFHLHRFKDNVQVSQQYFILTDLLQRGIGFHHSGLFPLLKEIVEILFLKGLIKVLFATETMAIGVNLPVKTAIFTSYRKFDEESQSMRMLYTDEYIQIAGRAGRRNVDTKGYVFYLPDRKEESLEDVKKMMCGSKTRLQSKMKFNYDFILKTINGNNLNWVSLVESSYFYKQVKVQLNEMEIEKKHFEKELESIKLSEEQIEECLKEETLKNILKTSTNSSKRKAQSEYESWKNKHPDKIWDPIKNTYKRYIVLQDNLKAVNEDLIAYADYNASIEPYFNVLIRLGFMNSNKSLTKKGINATEVNEGNPLLMSELYEEKVFTTLTKETILMILSCFMEKTKDDNNDTYNIYEVESLRIVSERICKQIEKAEQEQGISYKKWSLNYEYVPILHDLFNRTSVGTICENYEIMEGNLTRFLLKLLNIVDELKNIATLNNDTKLLEKLEDIRAYEFYKIAIPDSLYLHI
jgi:superfamily II RNA helicase